MVRLDERELAPAPASIAPGRRDRKKLATRLALRMAAVSLVAERGFAHVTAEDIAEAADVSTRTFFNYFPSKESALVGMDPHKVEHLRAALLARPAEESPIEAMRAVIVEHAAAVDEEVDELGESKESWFRRLSIVREDPDLMLAYAAHSTEVERALVTVLRERLGVPATDPYPALLAAAVLAVTRVAALQWSAGGAVDSFARLTAAAIDALAGGLVDCAPFAQGVRTATSATSPSTATRTGKGTRR